MDNRHGLFALHQLQGVGWKTIQHIMTRLSSLDELGVMEAADWSALGFTPARANALGKLRHSLREGRLEAELRAYEQAGVKWTTVWDEDYPELLRETADPPWMLYSRGDITLLSKLCIGVVGTRTPTVYGRTSAERLAAELSQAGVCIISGLARGIDSFAHEGALLGHGRTAAVLGCGMDTVYPAENKQLFQRIIREGLVLTEYPLGTKPHAGLFPLRNRVIAGLSAGVLVIEAAVRSGSLITADLATGYSRDVFAVPGPINSPKSQGTLKLIKDGAKLVASAGDVLEEYPDRIEPRHSAYSNDTSAAGQRLSADEALICGLLADGPLTIDQLLLQSQFTFGHLHAVLINLLMMQRIVEIPGTAYTLR
ncbi:DNA processing protein [Paenibacillus sp. UNCCL117]|uniref:DNA-processing protein DprA n=1 Tax=unclassified Paenibacillus TaxID=185978 RepID=UPI0008837138|nr:MULTISPECIES: DNA-processing protein DprA [unclassified Paenibacillus]SDC85786.1 DNA processing protein [Paenibacillus sp. cl123]SFW27646.1 DNA processing protein [Paenibacillus sp. UNCCL117]